jgi:hypothetical protein
MDTKKILSWISLLLGETLLIAAFILFRGNLATNILVLNIVISSFVYLSHFVDILVPWIDFSDKSHKTVGSLGIRWFFSGLYAIAVIAVMILGNVVYEWAFSLQIILHGILFSLLLLGFAAAFHSSVNVEKVYKQETANCNEINEMKTAMRNLKDRMYDLPDLPEYFATRIKYIEENIRFISPANIPEAYELERMFTKIVIDIAFAISDFSTNEEAIKNNIKKLERIFQKRKQVYSN